MFCWLSLTPRIVSFRFFWLLVLVIGVEGKRAAVGSMASRAEVPKMVLKKKAKT
jgi:hypothetical protein